MSKTQDRENALSFLFALCYNECSLRKGEISYMKVIDISQEVFSCRVYPGDPAPQMQMLMSMDEGELYNLSSFAMCAHNGTHVDAPAHFIHKGKTVDGMPVETFVGACYVWRGSGDVGERQARKILEKAAGAQRILLAGDVTVTAEGAQVFADAGILLLGNESQTVGPEDAPMAVHLILLSAGVCLLEGVKMDGVAEGRYLLSAAPLNLSGCEGAPCRAVLIEE